MCVGFMFQILTSNPPSPIYNYSCDMCVYISLALLGVLASAASWLNTIRMGGVSGVEWSGYFEIYNFNVCTVQAKLNLIFTLL